MSSQNGSNLILLTFHTPSSFKTCKLISSADSLTLYFEALKHFNNMAAIGGGGNLSLWFNNEEDIQRYLQIIKNDSRTESIDEGAVQSYESTLTFSTSKETKRFRIVSTVPSCELFRVAFENFPCFKGTVSEKDLCIECKSERSIQRYLTALSSDERTISFQQV